MSDGNKDADAHLPSKNDPTRRDLEEDIPAHDPPAWFDEFSSALSYADHLVLSGNVRDLYPLKSEKGVLFLSLQDTLQRLLAARQIRHMLVFDPIDGFEQPTHPVPGLELTLVASGASGALRPYPTRDLAMAHAKLVNEAKQNAALVVDYAAHLHGSTREEIDDFFVEIDKHSRVSHGPRHDAVRRTPTIWIVERPADLPDWFVVGNDYLREIQIEHPNLEDRFLYAQHLAEELAWAEQEPSMEPRCYLQQFALETEGETLVAMRAMTDVMTDEGLGPSSISEAVRIHRTGSRRNPWTSPVLFSRVRDAKESLGSRIKGQPRAIERTLDILARAIMGLSGVQSNSQHHKPRGVLFFAGPTGVGKTELAKAVTELLFGDESACQRFDMSEFMEEASISRLIGAAPGRPGHERGGELVNAANRRPFSVFLFDEIEKAHPRVLDMFLQILDEGRLTDSRGATAHFAQALIIFTSNIGVVGQAGATNGGMNILPSDSYGELESKIELAIQDHFRKVLRRPEILNRIGQNVVVFDFLSHESASMIFEATLKRVLENINRQHGVCVELSEKAHKELRSLCTHDYFDGGRGIGNRVETHFINPLARQLFDRSHLSDLCVTDIVTRAGKTRLFFNDEPVPPVSREQNGAQNTDCLPHRFSHDEIEHLRKAGQRRHRLRPS